LGRAIFTGSNYWLEIGVRNQRQARRLTHPDAAQALTPVPLTHHGQQREQSFGPAARRAIERPGFIRNLSGTYGNSVTFNSRATALPEMERV